MLHDHTQYSCYTALDVQHFGGRLVSEGTHARPAPLGYIPHTDSLTSAYADPSCRSKH